MREAELGILGGYAAEQVDGGAAPEALERALRGKIEEIRKARSAPTNPQDTPGTGKKKKKKAAKKAPAAAETIKNGLTQADRQVLGKLVLTEIAAGQKAAALADLVQKELERLRAERVKASSTADTPRKKKNKSES